MQIREEEKKRQEGEADERGGSDRSEKEVAGERWKRWEEMEAGKPAGAPAASPQPGGRMRQWRDPITRVVSWARPGFDPIFYKMNFPGVQWLQIPNI